MSHLPHLLDYKAALNKLGITCPKQTHTFCNEAFVVAAIRNHFKWCDRLGLSADEEESLWEQLDRWNKVSPIDASTIFNTVKYRINTIRASLIAKGTPPVAFTTVVVIEGTEGVDITANPEFETLVCYLQQELRNGDE